jgi:hypothetical protein
VAYQQNFGSASEHFLALYANCRSLLGQGLLQRPRQKTMGNGTYMQPGWSDLIQVLF